MSSPVETANADQSVEQFLHDVLVHRRHSALPVLNDHEQLRGQATLHRLRAVPSEVRRETTLRQVACPWTRSRQPSPGSPSRPCCPA
ncbi:CBS domain-containing protein [Saccharopolyspora phatthalungensis]|uniref:CBS-domain-containing membrane protein n=1 Tax=Saccharopolyspora phatthalungensis TaxID=664693 RepID=A0A840Q7Q1_9PSEU|nr:CBS-domain-containing membrane protein [Saccharopolyspora phatthalungensis]